MDKKIFKTSVLKLLRQDVIGLSDESKIKYMKKWIRDYERENQSSTEALNLQDPTKVGLLVRTTIRKIIGSSSSSLSSEKIAQLQDERYCKTTFDINYPFLKKVMVGSSLSQQRKINGYDRYWEGEVIINGERYIICNDWYERNKPRFIKWVNNLGQ
jgi:hypothetical protein